MQRQATLALLSTPTIGVDNGELIPFEEDSNTLGSFSLGRTKLFLKHPQALSALEVLREKKLPEVVGFIEGAWRRYKVPGSIFAIVFVLNLLCRNVS